MPIETGRPLWRLTPENPPRSHLELLAEAALRIADKRLLETAQRAMRKPPAIEEKTPYRYRVKKKIAV